MPPGVKWAACAGALMAGGTACFALGTWWSGAWQRATFGAWYVPMAPSTALVLAALSAAVIGRCLWPDRRMAIRMGQVVAGATALVSALVIMGFVLGTDLPWERWLSGTNVSVAGMPVGRMSVLTAGMFLAAAISLGAQLPPFMGRRLLRYAGFSLAGLGLLFGLVTALAYATATPIFYGLGMVPMALLTAVAFVALDFSLLLTGSVENWRRRQDRELEAAGATAAAQLVWRRVMVVALVGLGIALAGFFYLQYQQRALGKAIGSELGAIADLKAGQIANWRTERLADARFLMRAPDVARDLALFLARPDSPERRTAALGWLNLLKGGDRYEVLAFFDPRLDLRLATPGAAPATDPQLREELTGAARSRDVVLGDLFLSAAGGIRLDIVAPVAGADAARPGSDQGAAGANLVGLILLRLDPRQFLFPLLQTWPVPSATAETLLVRREGDRVVYLNELRHRKNTALLLSRPVSEETLVAARAVLGAPGPIEGLDYRGVPVLAAYRTIPGTPWVMIAKVDQAEIYAPLGREALTVGLIVALLLLTAGLGSLVYRRQRHADLLRRHRDQLETMVRERTAALHAEIDVRRQAEAALQRQRERLEDLVAQRTAALHESERRFQVLFEQAHVAISVARDSRVLFVNPACARLFGFERAADMVGHEMIELIAPNRRPEMEERLRVRSASEPGPGEYETVGLRRDGTEFPMHAAVNRIDLADGPATLSFLTDITSRKRVERALSESEARFHSLFDSSADGILLTIPDGRILAANQAACRMLGRTEAEICEVGRAGIVDMQDPNAAALIAERTRTGSAQGEMTLIRRDGSRIPVEVSSAIFATGEGLRTSMVIRDITERKRVEAALKESEYFLARSQEVAALGSYKFEVAIGTWSGTPELDRIFGIDEGYPHDTGGWLGLIVPEHREMMRQHLLEDVIARGGRFEKEYQIVRRNDGQTRWLFGLGKLEFDTAGRPARMIGVIRDITDQRQAEQALRESEVRFRTLVENAPEAVFVGTNPNAAPGPRFAYLNAAALRLFGAKQGSELVGKSIRDRIHPGSRELLERRIRETMEAPSSPPQEEVYLRLDGTPVPVEVAAARIDYLGETGAVVFVRDITERKRAEEKIKEQTILLETASDAIMVRDLQHRILYWNQSAERLYGWKAEEVLGREVPELQFMDPAALENAFEVVMKTGDWTGEARHLTKARQEITVLSRWSLVRDEQGRPKSIFVINTDITERKKLETQLYRAQRLESIGQLASGIAHDLNNILAPLVMVAPLLRAEIKSPETLRLVDILESNTKRGVDVVKQILTFSRGLKAGKGPVPGRPLLKEISNVLDETFPKSIRLQSSIPEDLWMVEGDATQLHQVLMNLCVNARDAMPDGGTLTLAAENVVVDELYASMSPGAKPGPYTVWLVADTGMGIPRENLDRIFDPFFTTKEPGKGTGLGLSTVLGIVRSHGGFLKVESAVGKGTQFRVYLPAQIGAQAPAEPPLEPPPPGRGETILVVDDEEGVRVLTKKVLEQHGYHVLLASEGSEAVVVYAQHAGEIHAVVTDLMMPLMDGATLIRALKQITPAVRILATTGVTESVQVAAALRLGAKEVLRKPYPPHVLLRRLRIVLDEPNPAPEPGPRPPGGSRENAAEN